MFDYQVIRVKNYTTDSRKYKCFMPEYYVVVTAPFKYVAVAASFVYIIFWKLKLHTSYHQKAVCVTETAPQTTFCSYFQNRQL
jgi:hypothetical protein